MYQFTIYVAKLYCDFCVFKNIGLPWFLFGIRLSSVFDFDNAFASFIAIPQAVLHLYKYFEAPL
jgi:hypothetical protein